jgi:hypothetical protein
VLLAGGPHLAGAGSPRWNGSWGSGRESSSRPAPPVQ